MYRVSVIIPICVVGIFVTRTIAADESEVKWRIQPIQGQHTLENVFFVNEQIGWICAEGDAILKTTDGGTTWAELATNLPATGSQVSDVWFLDSNHGWAAGEIRQEPTLWETTDGGLSWSVKYIQARALPGSHGFMTDVSFTDRAHGWGVGSNNGVAFIVATSDGGEHWTIQYSGGEIARQFNLVRFWDSLHGWALASNSLLRTDDGGASWELRYFESESHLNDIDIVGPSEVWVAGAWGHLVHTEDGFGWDDVPITGNPNKWFVGYVKFRNKSTGWAWGVDGNIVMTRDGGRTWVEEPHPLIGTPESRAFTGSGTKTGSKLIITLSPGGFLSRSTDDISAGAKIDQ